MVQYAVELLCMRTLSAYCACHRFLLVPGYLTRRGNSTSADVHALLSTPLTPIEPVDVSLSSANNADMRTGGAFL
jgi:hypothetical protein